MEMTRQEAEKFLRKIGRDLKSEQSLMLKKLESRVKEEFRGRRKFIEVVTSVEESENLLPLETGDSIFFGNQPPIEDGIPRTLPSEPFFLHVPYEEFHSLLSRDFVGANFTYQLKPNYRFVAAEEKIYRAARLYDLPLEIYSPYARRAVDICILGKLGELDLKLAENNLVNKLITDKKFYWNVKIDSVPWDSVVTDEKFFEYRCTADDLSFVLPSSDATFDDELEVRRAGEQIIFRTPRELSNKRAERIKILPVENKIALRILSKKRLRTQGDIEFVLSGLKRDDYSCRFGNFGATTGNINRYSKEHEYFSALDENLLRAKNRLPGCIVKFSGKNIFLTDYANFVLRFLEENYPEFNWIGERDE